MLSSSLFSLPSLSGLLTALVSVLATFSGWFVLLGLYRIFLHPLRKYPGPFLARWTDGYMAYYAWRGDRHLELYRLHQKYGPVVRVTPNTLSFNTASALKTIYSYRANVQKSAFYTAFPANKNTYNVHSSINKLVHARKRRVLSHAFSDAALKSVERFIISNIETACSVLSSTIRNQSEKSGALVPTSSASSGWGRTFNAADWANYLTFDIMGDLSFGKSFNMLTEPTNRFAADLVTLAAHSHLICGTHLLLHRTKLDRLIFPSIAGGRERYVAYSRAQLTERQKLGTDTDRKDIFYHLLQARDPDTGLGFGDNELWGESNVLIIAGSDTTSTAMAATLHYILHNPAALAKITNEVRTVFSYPEEIVTGAKLNECVFLRACIEESLRLAPPVPGYLPRQVLQRGMEIDGHHIPAGTDVGVPHYPLHHNEDYYPRPFEFIPERWILGAEWPEPTVQGDTPMASRYGGPTVTTKESLELVHSAFCPFSIGPRGCIGKGLAYAELTTSLAHVLFRFDMRPAPADPIMDQKIRQAIEQQQQQQQRGADQQGLLSGAERAVGGPEQCPFMANQMGQEGVSAMSADEKGGNEKPVVVKLCPFKAEKMVPWEYPLMDTFTSRKDGPMMQVRQRQY